MRTITVTHPNGSYPIYLADGVLAQTGAYLADLGYTGRCAVVTNPTVGQYHAGPLLASLQAAGFEPARIDIPDGEQFKTLATVAALYDRFIEAKLDRRSPVIALGGGVLGDTAGFAAASFLRGVPLVQLPTTLLAMVDSSVGGKTGVDLPQGKNLVGAFKQPELVLIDPTVLATLPPAEFRAGLAEVIKHGIIDAPALFEALEKGGGGAKEQGNILEGMRTEGGGMKESSSLFPRSVPQPSPYSLSWLLAEAIMVKVRVVQQDPFEQGRRAVLNLGHTFGHAFEQLSNYEIRHGEGVAMGLVCAARLAARLGYCSAETADRIGALLQQVGLPAEPPPYPAADVWAAMFTDKKRQGNTLRFILPRAIGDVDIFPNIEAAEVQAILHG
jgi:3-dehydroquinate synthase